MRQSLGRGARLAACLGLVGMVGLAPSGAQAADPVGFQASTSATGVLATITIPGAPVTDQFVNSGGPTAQASLDTFGSGVGYAAFPDPGPFLRDFPGLLPALLKVPLPAPDYPMAVSADDSNPEASVGSGIYRLQASQSSQKTESEASAGVDVLANAALVQAKSSVVVSDDGSVVAKAVSDVQGVTVGPLTLGQVRSTVTRTLTPDGQVETQTASEVTGVRVGTIPISIGQDAVNVAGNPVPLPLGQVAETLLKPLGVTVTVLPSATIGDTVVTGALQIDGPLPGVNVGTGPATFRLVLGQASVSLTTGGAALETSGTADLPPASPEPGSSSGAPASAVEAPAMAPAPAGAPVSAPAAAAAETPAPAAAPAAGPVMSLKAQLAALHGAFGISNLYLVVAFTGLAAFLTESLVRLLGVRRAWTSTRG